MSDKTITRFLLEGSIGLNSVGKPIDLTEGYNHSTIEKHSNGITVLYTWFYEDLEISLGTTADGNVDYLVVYIDKQKSSLGLVHNKSNLNLSSCTLEQFVSFLNHNNISWRFRGINDCFLFIELTQTGNEILFSYYPDDRQGLHFIQNVQPKNNPNKISRTNNGWIYVDEKAYGIVEKPSKFEDINGFTDTQSEAKNRFSSLDDSISLLTTHSVKWFFYGIKDQCVSILIPSTKTELIYNYKPAGIIGLQSIQTDNVSLLDKDNIKINKGYFYLNKRT